MKIRTIYKLLLGGILATQLQAIASETSGVKAFEANNLMRAEIRWVVNSLERLHFSNKSLDEIDAEIVLVSYMRALDFNHLYFFEEDREKFVSRFAPPMARHLRAGNLNAAFQIFATFQERLQERMDWIQAYLEEDFTFEGEFTYQLDRSDDDWPVDRENADELWQARIQYELLNEILPRITREAAELGTLEEEVFSDDMELEVAETEEVDLVDFETALKEAREVLQNRYTRFYDEINRLEAQEVQEIFLSTLARKYDPHSVFLSSDSLEDLSIAIENALVGIGAVLTDDDGYCTIRELINGGPADLSGELNVNDQILAVAQGKDGEFVDIVGMKLRKVVRMIRGDKETVVRLKIRPAEATDPAIRKEVVLVRDEVQLTANLARARLYQIPVEDKTIPIGVIELPSFYGKSGPNEPNSSDDVADLIAQLKEHGVEGIILDMRRNGGGLLSEAIELAGLFIPEGPVVQVKTMDNRILQHKNRDDSIHWDGPLMLLVSRFTASASEIVAGALQSYGRGLVVGDASTHGKGTVQGIFKMTPPLFHSLSGSTADGGATKVTVQKYYLPDGNSTQMKGILSDVSIPSINEYLPIGEADLDYAMEWDQIDAVPFGLGEKKDIVATVNEALIEFLRERSGERIENLEEFSFLEETIHFWREKQEEKIVSLNLETRQNQTKREKSLQEQFRERREELARLSFPFEKVSLLRSMEPTETLKEDDLEDVTQPSSRQEPFDIVLREGLRIMADWLSVYDESDSRSKTLNEVAESRS